MPFITILRDKSARLNIQISGSIVIKSQIRVELLARVKIIIIGRSRPIDKRLESIVIVGIGNASTQITQSTH